MTLQRPEHWLWDFWLADDGDSFHIFYLHAARSLGNPDLRHRNARIGHATSADLINWTDHGQIIEIGLASAFDDTAQWTGCVARGPDGRWYLFYTGARFFSRDDNRNIESIGLAVSEDLFSWSKLPEPVCRADARWYETFGTSSWPEEAWRDPWVFPDADGKTWHMLITARANHGDVMQRGVVGHATSADLLTWSVRPPLSEPGAGFAHLEVFETFSIEGRKYVLFSCDTPRLSGRHAGAPGGIWYMPVDSFTDRMDPRKARLLASQRLYAGRVVRQRNGRPALMGFNNGPPFAGTISDPIPIVADADGALSIDGEFAP